MRKTRFEQIGINRQMSARTINEAEQMMRQSCNSCTHSLHCLSHDCEHCTIKMAHEDRVAILVDDARRKGRAKRVALYTNLAQMVQNEYNIGQIAYEEYTSAIVDLADEILEGGIY